ncbi:MAG: DUF5107 domain-containing protein [Clostridia bacterium]|nr:DUF5107 domain-containing protein [Clostridia bacterium]
MTRLTVTTYRMPGACLGQDNPLPDLGHVGDAHAEIVIDRETVSDAEARYMGWGRIHSILPYTLQDGYDREKKEKDYKAIVLENDCLRATFLPTLGGRLWSLIDKAKGRELLHVNPVFQPANLALRNAWFSGGVEWNCGIIGHTPFTCSDVQADQFTLSDGTPVLSLWQYERVRHLVYRVDALLPEGSRQLLIRVYIHNTLPTESAVYWWSNMAVNEGEDVRVIVPAHKAFRYGYGGKLSKVPVPYMTAEADKLRGQAAKLARERGGTLDWDVSHSTCLPQSMDFFFDIPDGQRPFLAALGKDGYGICQTSTSGLRGRKLFVWGMGNGGRHWQEFLSTKGSAYIELQSGLARTQLEHLPMPGHGTITWLEAYGPVQADPSRVHGQDYEAAVSCVEDALDALCPASLLEDRLQSLLSELDTHAVQGTVLHAAPCFLGAELALHASDPGFDPGTVPYARMQDADTPEAENWLTLLRTGALPCPDVLSRPVSYMTDPTWEAILRSSVDAGKSDHWYGHYLLAVMAHARDDVKQAQEAYMRSVQLARNPWALRGLAVLALRQGDTARASSLLQEATRMLPIRPLAVEAMDAMLRDKDYTGMLALYRLLPESLRADGRLQVYRAAARLRSGDLAGAKAILSQDLVLADVREGETWLTDLWFECAAISRDGKLTPEGLAWARDTVLPPRHLDFRML